MVSADQPALDPALDPALVARAYRAVEPVHNHVYFVPETEQHLTGTGLRLPEFSLKPEQFIHKLASTFGYQDIDFVDHLDFSRRYLLRGPDEPAIRGAFAPQVLSFFQSQDKLCAESLPGGRLLVFRLDRRVKPDPAALRELVETALSVVAAFRGHPTREDARPTVEP